MDLRVMPMKEYSTLPRSPEQETPTHNTINSISYIYIYIYISKFSRRSDENVCEKLVQFETTEFYLREINKSPDEWQEVI